MEFTAKLNHGYFSFTDLKNDKVLIECHSSLPGVFFDASLNNRIASETVPEKPIQFITTLKSVLRLYLKLHDYKNLTKTYIQSEDGNYKLSFFQNKIQNAIGFHFVDIENSIVMLEQAKIDKYSYASIMYTLRKFLSQFDYFEYQIRNDNYDAVAKFYYSKSFKKLKIELFFDNHKHEIFIHDMALDELKEFCKIYVFHNQLFTHSFDRYSRFVIVKPNTVEIMSVPFKASMLKDLDLILSL